MLFGVELGLGGCARFSGADVEDDGDGDDDGDREGLGVCDFWRRASAFLGMDAVRAAARNRRVGSILARLRVRTDEREVEVEVLLVGFASAGSGILGRSRSSRKRRFKRSEPRTSLTTSTF